VSPLTASVNENSVSAIDVLEALAVLVAVEVLFELLELDAHAASAKTTTQNLMNRRKLTRN
jgi:hypothetical protein